MATQTPLNLGMSMVAFLAVLVSGCMGAENRLGSLGDTTAVVDLDGIDGDSDFVPDALESELCGRALVEQILEEHLDGMLASCDSASNFRLITVARDVFVPTGAIIGPDGDGDALPAWVKLEGYRIAANTASRDTLLTSSGPETFTLPVTGDDRIPIDTDDADADVPLISRVQVLGLPVGYAFGADSDADGLPVDVSILRMDIIVDRRGVTDLGDDEWTFEFDSSLLTIQASSEAPIVVPVDSAPIPGGDDTNPETPVVSRVTPMLPLPTGGVKIGPDADNDDLPASITLDMAFINVDRRMAGDAANVVTWTDSPDDQSVPIDTNDQDSLLVVVGPIPVPYWATVGADSDGDMLPSGVILQVYQVTIDRTRAGERNGLMFEEDTITVPIDTDDSNYDGPVPWNVIDADRDLIPDALEGTLCDAENGNSASDGSCSGDNYTRPDTDA